MSSGARQSYRGSVRGAAAEVKVETCPFTPRSVHLYAENAGSTATVIGYKSEEMLTDAYLSSASGWDTGVTITSKGFTLANGADVNVDGVDTYYECLD